MHYKELDDIVEAKGLKVVHVNTRSVFNKLDELKLRLKQFDIIVFTETWLNNMTDDSLLKWEGFNLVRRDRDLIRNKKGGGVCIYIHDSIPYTNIEEHKGLSDHNLEFILLKVKPHMQKPLNLLGVYRPPDGAPKECVDHLVHILNQLDRQRTDTLIIGDFNIDYKNKKLIAASKLEKLVTKLALKQIIKENTRVSSSSATCIDLLFTDIGCISDSGVINYNISDHLPIYLIKKRTRSRIKKKQATGRSYMNYDEDVFVNLLDHADWENFEEINDPEILWDIFHQNIIKILDQVCPIKSLTVVDWLTNELLSVMRQRDKAYKKARRTNLTHDWAQAKQLRNRVKTAVRTSKANVIKDKLERYQHNPKKFWQEINKLLPSSQSTRITGIVDETTGHEVPEESLMSHINDYFSSIGSKLADECTPGRTIDEQLPPRQLHFAFDRVPFTEAEVLKVCKDINVLKSSSLPNIKSHVIKSAFISNITRVTKIFNTSLSMSVFPQAWKLSTIIPLPKIPQPKSASDLRPVALTPLPGKLLEKLFCKRLQEWINNNNILTENQHGFRKSRSTISAIAQLLNDVYAYINSKVNPYIIFLDLKKAFDTVSHTKLIVKLGAMGLDEETLCRLESYLTNRQQCVKVDDVISDLLPISYGVPQGSILGPILFSLYINEIVNIVDCGIVLYADDTVIYHDDSKILQKNLRRISGWCNNNLLTINVRKSHWLKLKICAEEADNQTDHSFVINNLELLQVETYKYLGVLIDVNLNFQSQHRKVMANVNAKLAHFRKIRYYLTNRAAILIYKCTILPLLEYADFICDQGLIYINKSIQKLQNLGLSIAFNQHVIPYDQRDSSDFLHRQSGTFRLVHRRKLHLLQFAFLLKSNATLLDNRDIPTRRRVGILFMIPKSNHYKFPRNPYYKCMSEWNNLRVDVTLLPDRASFKKEVKLSIRDPYTKIL